MQQHNLVSKENGSINPRILLRDYELEAAYKILEAKYEALLEDMQSIKDVIEAEIEWCAKWAVDENENNLAAVKEVERDWFIGGLKQALYLIEKISPIA